jgi:hypothetical protein
MPSWLTLSTVKDAVIVIAIVALGWYVYRSGEDRVTAKDFAQQKQTIARYQTTVQSWQQQQTSANGALQNEIAQINGTGSAPPVVQPLHVELCQPASAVSAVLPAAPAGATSTAPTARATDTGPERDIGPDIEAFERKYETALAECRAVIAQWPKR